MTNKEKEVFESGKYKCPISISNIKKGDFLFCQSPTTIWLCIVSHIEGDKAYYQANYNLTANLLNRDDWFLTDYIKRKASPEEKELILQILDSNELLWIESVKKIYNMNEVLLVPDNITLYQRKDNRQIVIPNQNNSLVLIGGSHAFGVVNQSNLFKKIDCLMIPCQYKDLMPCDAAFRTKISPSRSTPDTDNPMNYVKIQEKGYVYLCGDSILKSYETDYFWFKIIKG